MAPRLLDRLYAESQTSRGRSERSAGESCANSMHAAAGLAGMLTGNLYVPRFTMFTMLGFLRQPNLPRPGTRRQNCRTSDGARRNNPGQGERGKPRQDKLRRKPKPAKTGTSGGSRKRNPRRPGKVAFEESGGNPQNPVRREEIDPAPAENHCRRESNTLRPDQPIPFSPP